MRTLPTIAAALAAAVLMAASPLLAGRALADQGIHDDEVVVGSVSDLSGIFAAFGAPAVATAQMHFDAVNAAGGIHGRKIRFVVEDMAYQMPKAMQAYNKLLNRDKVFAMLLSVGTPMNLAGLKLMTPRKVLNLTPLSAARQLLDEPIRLRFMGSASYYEQVRLAAGYMSGAYGVSRACTMYIPSDFGKEVQEAIRDEAGSNAALSYVAETTHKPDEADFVGALQKLDAEGCELIGLCARSTAGHHGGGNREKAGTRPPQASRLVRVVSHRARGGPGGCDRRTVRSGRLGRSGVSRRGTGAGSLHLRLQGEVRRVPRYVGADRLHRRHRADAGAGEGGTGAHGGQLRGCDGEPRLLRRTHRQPRQLLGRRPRGC